MNTKEIINTLQIKYDGLLRFTEEKVFFVSLAQYVDFFLKTKELEGPIVALQQKLSASGQSAKKLNEESNKNPLSSTEEDKEFQELKQLLTQEKKRNNFIASNEATVENAYFKLLHLRNLILERQQLEEAIKQSPNGYSHHDFNLESKELDRILLTAEQKLNRLDIIETNPKTGEIVEDRHRDYFRKEDYLSYLSLIHNFLLDNLSDDAKNEYPKELLLAIERQKKKDGRLSPAFRMVKMLIKNGEADNFFLAKCLDNNSKLKRKRYKENIANKEMQNDFNKQVKNVLETINKYWDAYGYNVKFSEQDNTSKITLLQK